MHESTNMTGVLSAQEEYGLYSSQVSLRKHLFLFTKRMFDIVMSLTLLVLTSPLFLILAIAIKLDSKGSVLFKHRRIGKDGKTIYLYKFRSMVKDAQSLLNTFTPEQKKEFEENYKLTNDPRITRVGKFIRKTSLDELPQLLNILSGDMSLIGPRPIVEKEIEKYGMLKDRFLSVTPGLTGYWACSGRSNISYDERIKLEMYYVNNCCWKLDIKIIFKTVESVVKRVGAF